MTHFKKNILTAAVLTCISGGIAPLAKAEIVAAICQVNDTDACASSSNLISGKSILTLRGYAYDIETGDRPQPGGYIQVRNEDTLAVYRLPVSRVEARPDIIAPKLTGLITPEKYSIVNAGFIAQVFTASLPPGSYSVVEARISMAKAGFINISLDASNRASFYLDESSSPYYLVKNDGVVVPLKMMRDRSGKVIATGYPPLRNGNYTIKAELEAISGVLRSQVNFNYLRPVLNVPVSIPLVKDFPGVISRITPINPLTKRPIDEKKLPLVVDAIDGSNIKLDGETLQPGQAREILNEGVLSGIYSGRFADEEPQTGKQSVEFFVNTPDAPTINVNINRWNPSDLIQASASRPSTPIKVEDFDIDTKLTGGSTETCQGLTLIRPEYRLQQNTRIVCAVRWENLPESIKYNPYRANALRGSVLNIGTNAFDYTSGVVYTDPVEKTTRFYPALAPSGTVIVHGVQPGAITFDFLSHKSLSKFYERIASRFPNKFFAYTDPEQERLAGVINVKARHRDVYAVITYSDGSQREKYSSIPESKIPLTLKAEEPWATYPVKIESWYAKAPEIRSEQVFDFVGVPLSPSIVLDRDLLSHDQAPTIVTGNLGIVEGRELSFDETKMGRWKVTVVEQKGKESEEGVVIGGPVDVGSDGAFSVDLGLLSVGSRTIKIVAQMLDKSNDLVDFNVESKSHTLVTQYGAVLAGKLTARQDSGAIPFRQSIYFSPDDPQLIRNIKSVAWEKEQEDGVWKRIMRNEVDEIQGMSYQTLLESPGQHRYRAVVVNRYSGLEFVTDPLDLHAYNLPSFTVEAPSATPVGKPVTLTVNPDEALQANYSWSFVSDGEVENASDPSGLTFTFTPKQLKSYVVEVTGRQDGAVETPQSAIKKKVAIKAVNPLAARATLFGPSFVEAGKTYRFQAQHNDVVSAKSSKAYEIKGYWSLPDGSRIDSLEIDYTVQPGDTGLSYYTYIDGYPEETSVAFHKLNTWVYQFPADWKIQIEPVYLDVPALVRYNLAPVNFNLRDLNGEPLTYTWSLPEGVSKQSKGDDQGTLAVDRHGTYQIAVQVSDTRGNIVNVTSDQFSILPPATVKTQAKMVSKYGETYYAPGSYYVNLKVLELPRGDRFDKNELIVNGEKIGEFSGSSSYVSFAQAGEYEVLLRTLTKLGNYGETVLSVVVEPPPEPNCSFEIKATSSGVYLAPNCTVDTGYVRSYTWDYDLDGQPQQSTSKSFVVMNNWLKENKITSLTLTVESDLGAKFKKDFYMQELTSQLAKP